MTSLSAPAPNASTDDKPPALIEFHPAVELERVRLDLPIHKVTLLEDRAQILRRGKVVVAAGAPRLALWDVAPVLQDVSLRVGITDGSAHAKVADARVRRAMRVGYAEKPEVASDLELKLEELQLRWAMLLDDAERARGQAAVVLDMMQKATDELPDDAAWSLGEPGTWRKTFETLSERTRILLAEAQATRRQMLALQEQAGFLISERQRLDRPDFRFLTLVEVDLTATGAGEVTLEVEYTVPNALWRPTHTATLRDGKVAFDSRAAVWQNTGEDWRDVELVFSTARSSLGHEPPKLSDDRLTTKKKDTRVVVAAREVAVQTAGLGGGGGGGGRPPPPAGVELPGVDDGGDIQNLRSLGRVTIPSDGRPAFVPVFLFSAPADLSLVVMAERDARAHHKAELMHTGRHPVLAGPVDLVRTSGFVGTTRTLYVAPGERFTIGFGSDDDLRVQRTIETHEEVDDVDRWRRKTCTVTVYLSNLGAEDKTVQIVERLPVSEIEHVKVTLVKDRTSGAPELDANGMLTWKMTIGAWGRLRLLLEYEVAMAPDVAGL
jgi:uncharacterized protein (TIGR02231 family)